MMLSLDRLLIVIVGPTAVGKTQVAIELAERFDGEIVSADSRLFYRGMDVGTAKPSPDDRRRVPHHLVDVANPDESWSLGKFQREARTAIAGIHARGRLPFLVGGTGQYSRAVIDGWVVPEIPPDPSLRSALEAWVREVGRQGLHQRLAVLDPHAAQGIDYRNVRRTIRALEVIFKTGLSFTEQRQRRVPPYRALQLGLTRPRGELYALIDQRIEVMFAAGWVDEVRQLLEMGYSRREPAFSAIGYRQVISYLEGECSMDEAVIQIKRITRQLVRHQANWFKPDDPHIHWFQATKGVVDEMEAAIRDWLGAGSFLKSTH